MDTFVLYSDLSSALRLHIGAESLRGLRSAFGRILHSHFPLLDYLVLVDLDIDRIDGVVH